jgi:very-short-patch-repair endonuclease
MERDSRRDLAMLDHGLQVLRIRNQEVIQDPPKVLAKIRRLLPSPHGRGAGVRGM